MCWIVLPRPPTSTGVAVTVAAKVSRHGPSLTMPPQRETTVSARCPLSQSGSGIATGRQMCMSLLSQRMHQSSLGEW